MLRLVVLVLPLLLAGCYLTKHTVIPPEKAEAIPGIEGVYKVDRKLMKPVEVEIVAVPGSYVYQLRDPNAACLADLNDSCEQGRLLSMHGYAVGKNRYLVEIWDLVEREETGTLLFIAFDGKNIAVLEPEDAYSLPESQAAMPELSSFTAEQENFAKTRDLELSPEATELTGPPAAVLAFLEAHSKLKFKEHRLLVREH
jgi:hypothetical protein